MRLAEAARAGLGRWPWLFGPVFVTATLAALIGSALEDRVTYRVTRVLKVTEGAPAEAIFVCRSRDVLASAMQKAGLRPLIPPEELAAQVTTKHAGESLVHLAVERASRREAEDLAAAIAIEASKAVEVISASAAEGAQARLEPLRRRLRHRRLDRKAALAELDDLKRRHPQEIDERGRPLGTAQKRLIAVQDTLAAARRDLAAADAEVALLRSRLDGTPELTQSAGATGGETAARAPSKLGALEEEIARARRELTDRHPRLAGLLAERARLEAELVRLEAELASPLVNPLRAELDRRLVEAEVRRSRAAAAAASLEEQEKYLGGLFEQSLTVESEVRKINDDLAKAEADIKFMRRALEKAERESAGDATTRAALVDLTGPAKSGPGASPRVEVLRTDAPPARLAILGGAFGLMLGVLLAALAEAIDPVVRTAGDVERVLDMPVLAAVPAKTLPPGGVSRVRGLGLALWLAAFLLAAAALIVFVYPGWGRVRSVFSRAEHPAPLSSPDGTGPDEIEEVLP